MDLETVVRDSWSELLQWVQEQRIYPENEEEIQCFLYYAIIKRLGDATLVKPKPTTDKPEKLIFADGKLLVGNMHFPDLLIGAKREVVVEIKFTRERRASNIFSGCKSDVLKMKKHYPDSKRFFVLYDVCPENVFLSASQRLFVIPCGT